MKGDCHADPRDWLWLRVRKLQQVVANYFGVPAADLRGSNRSKSICRARTMAMGIARVLLGLSYPELGRQFGGRDHSTAIMACRRFDRYVAFENPDALALLVLVRHRLDEDGMPAPSEPPKGDRFIDELVRAGVRKP